MRVDAHHHFWEVERFDYGWIDAGAVSLNRDFLPQLLQPALTRAKVDATVLVQVLNSDAETNWLMETADTMPTVLGVVAWVDLKLPSAEIKARIDELQSNKLVGIRHLVHEEPDDNWLTREDVVTGLRVLESESLPFDLLIRPQHLAILPTLATLVPGLRMVVDHAAKPRVAERDIDRWSSNLRRAAENPNLYCKISGLVTEAGNSWDADQLRPYVEVVLEAFGLERVMLGTDWPVCTMAGAGYEQAYNLYEGLVADIVGSGALAQVSGGTALRFYDSRS